MGVQVKICGINTAGALHAARDAGADFIGLVFYPESPRNVTMVQAAELAANAEGLEVVALTVDANDELLREIVNAVRPGYLQLHGNESLGRVAEIRELTGTKIIKAVKAGSEAAVRDAIRFEAVADIILFDAPPPSGDASLPGGNGETFDWTILRSTQLRPNFMLSGGLNPDNVRRAIEIGGASSVDVSSGVEDAPGHKNAGLIERFVTQAKSLY